MTKRKVLMVVAIIVVREYTGLKTVNKKKKRKMKKQKKAIGNGDHDGLVLCLLTSENIKEKVKEKFGSWRMFKYLWRLVCYVPLMEKPSIHSQRICGL